MSPVTRSRYGRLTSDLRQVSRNPGHFRVGRWYLTAEGVLLVALGVAGFASDAMNPDAAPVGASVLLLQLTPWHSAVLCGFGVLAILGSMQRRAAITVTTLGAVGFAVLVIVGAVASAHHAPGPLGFEPRDIVLHGALAALNFAVLYWLIPDVLEGPDWIVRPGLLQRKRPDSPTPAPARVESASPHLPAGAVAEAGTSPEPSATGRPAQFYPDAPGSRRGPRRVLDGHARRRPAQRWFSRHARSASIAAAVLAAAAATLARVLGK